MFAEGRLNIHFLFTQDGYRGFLLRHDSFSYVIVSQKMYKQDLWGGATISTRSLCAELVSVRHKGRAPPPQIKCSKRKVRGGRHREPK